MRISYREHYCTDGAITSDNEMVHVLDELDDLDCLPLVMAFEAGRLLLGFAGDAAPAVSFPMVVGTPQETSDITRFLTEDIYFGDEAIARQARLTLNYPMEKGFVKERI